jgi:chromate reductase
MKVLGISGSLRAESLNSRLLDVAGELLPGDAELVVWSGLKQVPPYDEDDRAAGFEPAAVADLKRAMAEADAVLIATPEYNHSIPGVLKNALDWVSRPLAESPLRSKPTAVIGASTGMFGAVWAQAETRKVAGALGARVLDRELPVGHAQKEGALHDPELREELRSILDELVAEARPIAVAA